jgi:hypothetical protein
LEKLGGRLYFAASAPSGGVAAPVANFNRASRAKARSGCRQSNANDPSSHRSRLHALPKAREIFPAAKP